VLAAAMERVCVMPPAPRHRLDKNVSPNWKPPAGFVDRKPRMLWSDRIWHWLVSLSGLCLIGLGVLVMAYLHLGRWGGAIIGAGFATFVLGFPSEAQKKGYRE
jgi:hypothetical protein